MAEIRDLNKYILEQVKAGNFDKEIALNLLKELNNKTKKRVTEFAVIGIGCRLPDADSHAEYWENLKNGVCSVKRFPKDRCKDAESLLPGNKKLDFNSFFRAGYIKEIDKFDAEYFKTPPRVAKQMDPYQRLFLEVMIEAIEDAGYCKKQYYGSNTGVFVGTDHTHKFQASYINLMPETDFTALTGSWSGVLSSRASYFMNFSGPSLVIDTACSSGMSALNVACQSIQNGECEQAVVGSVNLFVLPKKDEGQMNLDDIESKSDEIRAFDRFADGTIWGEGVCSVLIKPLDEAIKNKDNIYGIIKAVAVNNDGASNGISAPNAKAQEEVLVKAWKMGNINPETLAYVEAHGTGTELGDPIEIKGLNNAIKRFSNKKQFCGIGSVKTNLGHLVGSSGLASFIKVLLSLKNKQIPPTLNFDVPNTYIDFCNSPLYVSDRLKNWEEGETPRRAGINSFSINGTNCHVVLEEAPEKDPLNTEDYPNIFTLSARNKSLLKESINRYKLFFDKYPENNINDICYTVNTGRELFAVRLAFVVKNIEDLKEKISLLYTCRENLFDQDTIKLLNEHSIFIHTIEDKINGEQQRKLDSGVTDYLLDFKNNRKEGLESLRKVCLQYIIGASVKWDIIYQDSPFYRINLPTTPFIKDRYWVSKNKSIANLELTIKGKGDKTITETENQIARIWASVLEYNELDCNETLFSFGGDSVSAMQIINLVNNHYNVKVSVSSLLKYSTISIFSEFMDKEVLSGNLESNSLPALKKSNIASNISTHPVSSAQRRMYYLWHFSPESTAYNISGGVIISDLLSLTNVTDTISQMVKRHEILRTSFELQKGNPVQIVHLDSTPSVHFIDACKDSSLICENKEISMSGVNKMIKDFVQPYDLSQSSLFRVLLVHLPFNKSLLIFDFHHIISDGTSLGMFIAEFSAISASQIIPLPEFQYKDFSYWQKQITSDGLIKSKEDYWLNKFGDEIPVLNLQTDFQRPQIQSLKGDKIKFNIDQQIKEKLNDLAVKTGTTLNMIMMSVLNVLLNKYTSQEDIIIGMPISGRNHTDVERIMGMFVNTLAIRNKPANNKTFEEFLGEVKTNMLEALDNQDYQFEELIDKLDIERDTSRNPLFDIMFQMQNEDLGFEMIEDQGLQFVDFETGMSKFDITLTIRERRTDILGELEYCTELFKNETIHQFIRHFTIVLNLLLEKPEKALGELKLITAEEEQIILNTFNNTKTDYPVEKSINQIFEEQVIKFANKAAVICNGQSLSYSELNEKANTLANKLVLNNSNKPIGLIVERSINMLVGILGILKAGKAYLPIDADYPEDRINYIIEDSGVEVLLTTTKINEKLNLKGKIILLDANIAYSDNIQNTGLSIDKDDLAYVMYTSGSTGEPKGVMVKQKNVVRLVKNTNFVELSEKTRILQTGAPVFDATTFEIWGSLLNGGTLSLVEDDVILDPKRLEQAINTDNINTMWLTAPLFNQLIDQNENIFKNIKYLLVGGDILSPQHINKLRELVPDIEVINGYGPTENTTFSTTYTIKENYYESIPIGKPINNSTAYILDKNNNLLPVGFVGELCLGGDGLAIGYLNNDELTKQKFINNPFKEGEKLYKTGDLAMWLPDGNIKFLGRVDFQVKIRGFRIELSEIEVVANKNPKIKETLVIARTEHNKSKSLCIYYVTNNGENLQQSELRDFLSLQLPDYMVPAYFVLLDKFPLNKNGKIDRKCLPEPVAQHDNYVEPETDNEKVLAEIWQQILGIQKVGINDNFFHLGGDSIKAIQICSKLQEQNIKTEVTKIFRYPTIKELQNYIVQNIVEAEQGVVEGELFMTPVQKWFFENNDTKQQHFVQGMVFSQNEKFNEDALKKAFEKVTEHHDALRIVFLKNNDKITPINKGVGTNNFKIYNYTLEDNIKGSEEKYIIKTIEDIDLENGPLVNLVILNTPTVFSLYVIIHHLVVDGVSWRVLIEDFILAYNGIKNNTPVKFAAKTTSFKEWSKQVFEFANSNKLNNEIPYWKNVANTEIPAIQKIVDDNKPVVLSSTKNIEFELDNNITGKLMKEANIAYNTESNELLISALSMALNEWSGVNKFLLNLEGHGREEIIESVNINRTVGWFTSMYPVIIEVWQNEIAQSIKYIKDYIRHIPLKGIGYGLIKYCSNSHPDLSGLLKQLDPKISFNYLGQFQQSNPQLGMEINPLPIGLSVSNENHTSYYLDFNAFVRNNQLTVSLRYSTNHVDSTDIDMLIGLFKKYITTIVDHCVAKDETEVTASDFSASDLNENELNQIFSDLDF